MESKNRSTPRNGYANNAHVTDKRTGYNYRRIASRHSRPSSSISLKTIFLWMLMAIAVAVAFDRLRPHGKTAPPDTVSSAQESEGNIANHPTDTVAEVPPSDQAQAAPGTQVPLPTSLRALADEEEKKPATEQPVKVRLNRDKAGNYVGQGTINQKNIKLLADTGASVVVVPEKIAKQIGLKSGQPMQVRTAGGLVTNYATTLDSLTIGPIQIRNIEAVINPSMQEDFALLGMSALALLNMTLQDGSLILSYDPGKGKDQATGPSEAAAGPVHFKKSVKECLGSGKIIDQKTLNCLNGN